VVKQTIYCEIAPPGNQYSSGVYAFENTSYTSVYYIELSKYVWAQDPIRGVRWIKNPDRDIGDGLARLTPEEEKQFFLARLRAQFL
jgi:hypothetical protein